MRALGAKFPVYVLVTKTDKVLGLTGLSGVLSSDLLAQAMGQTNNALKDDPAGIVTQTLDVVTDRLKDIRLLLLNQNPAADPSLLMFPDELIAIKPGLMAFVEATFEQNPYQETPVLRGLYFSQRPAGRQHLFSTFGRPGRIQGPQGGPAGDGSGSVSAGLLQPDPAGRPEYSGASVEYVAWRRMTRSLGLLAWLAVTLCPRRSAQPVILQKYRYIPGIYKKHRQAAQVDPGPEQRPAGHGRLSGLD